MFYCVVNFLVIMTAPLHYENVCMINTDKSSFVLTGAVIAVKT